MFHISPAPDSGGLTGRLPTLTHPSILPTPPPKNTQNRCCSSRRRRPRGCRTSRASTSRSPSTWTPPAGARARPPPSATSHSRYVRGGQLARATVSRPQINLSLRLTINKPTTSKKVPDNYLARKNVLEDVIAAHSQGGRVMVFTQVSVWMDGCTWTCTWTCVGRQWVTVLGVRCIVCVRPSVHPPTVPRT